MQQLRSWQPTQNEKHFKRIYEKVNGNKKREETDKKVMFIKVT